MATETSASIMYGGSREDLRDSLGSRRDSRTTVGLRLLFGSGQREWLKRHWGIMLGQKGAQVEVFVIINSLEREGASDEHWNLKGRLIKVGEKRQTGSFEATYNSRSRLGTIRFPY